MSFALKFLSRLTPTVFIVPWVVGQSGSITLSGVGGDFEVEAAVPDTGQCVVETVSGNIHLRIPQSTSARVYVSTSTGSFTHSGLTFTQTVTTQTPFAGTLGVGNAAIRLITGAGNISLEGF